MDAHPLKGPARWLILPGLSAAGGLVAGLAFQGIARGSGGPDFILVSGCLGLATALAVAIAPKLWMAILIAPPLATLGMAVSMFLLHYFPGEPFKAMSYVLLPSMQILGLLTTAPNVVLHGIRLKRKASWFRVGLILAILAGLASGLTLGEAFGGIHSHSFIWFCVLINVSGAAALEVSLRRSRVVS